ncbi:MAG: signal peptide peptidase SppA [bacterium]
MQDESDHSVDECGFIKKFAQEHLKEQRRARRWNVFLRLLGLALVGAFLWAMYSGPSLDKVTGGEHTALVELSGIIAAGADGGAEKMKEQLRKAFADKQAKGVILRINSPGGTPVQAAQINSEILRLRKEYEDMPFYVVVSDVCASGGYYVAVAAEKIYASAGSMVGSIGVRLDGFGVVKLMDKLGVESRTITAGDNKALLDPFVEQKPEQREHLEAMLEDVHQQFIEAVRAGRGDRLKEDEQTFSGLVWTGRQALDLGLVDAIGDEDYVAREVIGAEDIVTYKPRKSLIDELTTGVSMGLVKAWQTLNPRLGM